MHLESIIKPIFAKGPSVMLHAFVLMLLSIGLMFADKYRVLSGLKYTLSHVVSPLQYAVDFPFSLLRKSKEVIASQEALLKQNQQLRAQQVVLQLQLQKLQSTELENKALKELFSSSQYVKADVSVAQLLSVDSGLNKNEVLINKGFNASVFVGQAVLDAQGVMGQVVWVGPNTSRLMLLTDSRSAIPVENTESGFRAIAVGGGVAGKMVLQHVPKTEAISVGDVFVTSGLGQAFPQGYPVGRVVKVNKQSSRQFAQVVLQPEALINHSRLVLLLWLPSIHSEAN
jgi:rod shape-determining protein MreC